MAPLGIGPQPATAPGAFQSALRQRIQNARQAIGNQQQGNQAKGYHVPKTHPPIIPDQPCKAAATVFIPPHPQATMHGMHRHGISLIETIVVLCIIGLLIGLLFPAVHVAHEAARGTSCQNNLHQLVVALEQYRVTTKKFPKPALPNAVGGWAIAILPFLDDQPLADSLAGNPSISKASLLPIISHRPSIITCPGGWEGDSSSPGIPAGHYAAAEVVVGDVPLTSRIPWVESPLLKSLPWTRGQGPHWGGYYAARYAIDHASGDVSWHSGD